jgi:hypothetical protein
MTLKLKRLDIHKIALKISKKIVFIHHNSKHLYYLSSFYTFVYISKTFTLQVNFE